MTLEPEHEVEIILYAQFRVTTLTRHGPQSKTSKKKLNYHTDEKITYVHDDLTSVEQFIIVYSLTIHYNFATWLYAIIVHIRRT